jgi:glycosyltransferase involved in cell wall biosynthesis
MKKKLISIVTPCHNEQSNVEILYERVKKVFAGLVNYEYEYIFIDNDSQDATVSLLEGIAQKDPRIKIIINSRDFGFIRSSYYGLLQASGDAVILIFADLQDPPELISDFIQKWEKGHKIVKGIKTSSLENHLMYSIRKFYYRLVGYLSEGVELTYNFTGFGLYDKKVIEVLRLIDDPYPYLKGIISEIGFKSAEIGYEQEVRKGGRSSFNFYKMYDVAMVGITTNSNVPLRIASFMGFTLSIFSFIVAISSLILKIMYWKYFPAGIAAIIVGIFFMFSIQLVFIGILGEYIGLINKRLLKRPLVIESKRVNFDEHL